MLGPELETFRGNKIVMGLVAILGLGAAWLVYTAFTTSPPDNGFKILTAASPRRADSSLSVAKIRSGYSP